MTIEEEIDQLAEEAFTNRDPERLAILRLQLEEKIARLKQQLLTG